MVALSRCTFWDLGWPGPIYTEVDCFEARSLERIQVSSPETMFDMRFLLPCWRARFCRQTATLHCLWASMRRWATHLHSLLHRYRTFSKLWGQFQRSTQLAWQFPWCWGTGLRAICTWCHPVYPWSDWEVTHFLVWMWWSWHWVRIVEPSGSWLIGSLYFFPKLHTMWQKMFGLLIPRKTKNWIATHYLIVRSSGLAPTRPICSKNTNVKCNKIAIAAPTYYCVDQTQFAMLEHGQVGHKVCVHGGWWPLCTHHWNHLCDGSHHWETGSDAILCEAASYKGIKPSLKQDFHLGGGGAQDLVETTEVASETSTSTSGPRVIGNLAVKGEVSVTTQWRIHTSTRRHQGFSQAPTKARPLTPANKNNEW